ncbi:hypothetical protein LIER_37364 [Lithospermum erythrorhizon]|uniref:Uncharacterized protein n=1 Tax=Lithospermum erythrorhizon TaxID=34254 RepID=A0AAV3PJE7_LITER
MLDPKDSVLPNQIPFSMMRGKSPIIFKKAKLVKKTTPSPSSSTATPPQGLSQDALAKRPVDIGPSQDKEKRSKSTYEAAEETIVPPSEIMD